MNKTLQHTDQRGIQSPTDPIARRGVPHRTELKFYSSNILFFICNWVQARETNICPFYFACLFLSTFVFTQCLFNCLCMTAN